MPNQNDYAIVIGVQYYKGMLNELKGPHGDVQNFLDWLQRGTGADLPKENIGTFISTPTYTPLQDDIDEWITNLLDKLQQAGTKGRRLYFYFSGHGIGSNQLNSALLLPKWTYTMRNYALSSEDYLLELVNKAVFEEIFFFMDCCRNRIAGVKGRPPAWAAVAPAPKGSDYLLYYAAEFDNPAYEANLSTGNTLNNELPRGLFTKVLLDGLHGAAADRLGRLRVIDLVSYVKRNLPELAKQQNKIQVPKARITIDLDKEIVGPFPKTINVTIEFKTPNQNVILEDPELNLVKNGNTSEGVWELQLNRGEYTLRKAEDADGQKIMIDGLEKSFLYE